MQKTVITYTCDGCAKESDVETHRLGLDKKSVEVDLCERCMAKAEKVLSPLLDAGRRVRK